MKQGYYLVTFRRLGAADDHVVAVPSWWKLLWWMITTGIWCEGVLIAFLEDE